MRHTLFALFAMCALHGFATHIVGGEIYYTYLGNDDYQVTLKLYRDCGPGNTNNTALDAQAAIGVYNSTNGFYTTASFLLPAEVSVPLDLGNPCLTAPPTLCAKSGLYSGVIHLPSGTGGYTLAYQRCCRTPTILNLNNPGDQGLTCWVHVPDPNVSGANSSPAFDTYPPIALCLDQTMVIDQGATDADGDDLVYEVCAPFQGGDNAVPTPLPPLTAPPYSTVNYGAGYSASDQINSSPAMSIDASTGLLTLHPTMIGSFAVGICVKEYRDGVLLSQVTRDFRFDVVNCISDIVSSIQDQDSFCEGLTAQMHNESTGGNFYHWDFGVPGSVSDTSNEEEPSYTYPAPGTYTVMLVANPGWPCGDTSYSTFHIYDPLHVEFDPPPVLCPDQLPVAVTALGNFSAGATVQWDFGTGSISPNTNAANTTVSYSTLGSHVIHVSVEENGCTASFEDSISVFPLPVPAFDADTNGCVPFQPQFTNTSTAWTPMSYLWTLGDGSTSTDSLPAHLYTVPGTYDITLAVTTDSGCVATESLTRNGLISVWPTPNAQATAVPTATTVLFPDVTITDHTPDAVAWDFFVDGEHDTLPQFTHTFSDAGWYTVFLTATTGFGCYDTTSLRVFIGDHLFFAPTAFSPNGDGRNDVWKPSVIGARLYHLDIFDRWGHDVFRTTDPEKGWDGNGFAPGIYSFKAWLTEYGPLEKEYNGSFLLIK
jgi:gliding motility-associated-like protein